MKLPSHEEVVEFLQKSEGKVGKKDIARTFGIKGADNRRMLKEMLSDLKDEGIIEKSTKSSISVMDSLPAICEAEVTGVDSMGELIARPLHFRGLENEKPQIIITSMGKVTPPLAEGDMALLRVKPVDRHLYHGEALKRLTVDKNNIIGVFEKFKSGRGGIVLPAERMRISEFFIKAEDTLNATTGDLVMAEITGSSRGNNTAKIVKIIGEGNDAKNISLIALYQKHIPIAFPADVVKEAKNAVIKVVKGHRDLTHVPFVTIDGIDAHDFDDAVFAVPDESSLNPGGWDMAVAISDVSYYVKPGTLLDREAFNRGNSTYLPDRAVPMLPPELSSDICSLLEGKARAAVVFFIKTDKEGNILASSYERCIINSVARLNYEEVQSAFEGDYNFKTEKLKTLMDNLYGCFKSLRKNRKERGALELDRDERKIIADEEGIKEITVRPFYDSHRMIEEMMIAANVCAARALEKKGEEAIMYRVHARPSAEKIYALREFLSSIGVKFPKGTVFGTKTFNRIVKEYSDTALSFVINEMILRSQSQAYYSPDNLSHFGLALDSYVHFTSPIRRYSDMMVHRALFDEITSKEKDDFSKIAEHISVTERRSAEAERDTEDRFLAYYLSSKLGNTFDVVVNGVVNAGIFVTVTGYGASGFIPVSTLPGGGYYVLDEGRQQLFASSLKQKYTIGDMLKARLVEVSPLTGGLVFEVADRKKGK